MKANSRSRAAGGQEWHKMQAPSMGIRVVGAPECSFIQHERVPPEDLMEKQRIKEEVRKQVADYDESLITVIPAGKKAKRNRGNKK